MTHHKSSLRIWLQVALSGILTLVITLPTAALTDQQWLMFNKNQINYWNPQGYANGCVSGTNATYSGAQVFSNAEINAITANQPIYEAAANKYGFEWQILAAIHSAEWHNQRSNPNNGQGAYQLYSYTNGGTNSNAFLPAGAISEEEFIRQTDIAASVVRGKIDDNHLDLSKGDHIKRLFYVYNGVSSEYYQKAISMGFSPEQANNGEGSPYVMNRYDTQRDPTNPEVSPYWVGRYTSDGHYDSTSVSNRFGTYVKYLVLGGDGTSSNGYCVGSSNLIPGGMNLEQAKAFMAEYRNVDPSEWGSGGAVGPYNINATSCSGGDLANCVAFTQYFINRYTTYSSKAGGIGGIGNGGAVVSNLLARTDGGFTNGSTTPRAYAVFSISSGTMLCGGTPCGHTGIVLGIDTDNNQIIIGEAGCGQPLSWADAHVYKLNDWTNNRHTYAYTDGILSGNIE